MTKTYADKDDLRYYYNQVRDRGGFTTGATGVYEYAGERPVNPALEGTGECNAGPHIAAKDWTGPGWYVEFFDGHAERSDSEEDALLDFLRAHDYRMEREEQE